MSVRDYVRKKKMWQAKGENKGEVAMACDGLGLGWLWSRLALGRPGGDDDDL